MTEEGNSGSWFSRSLTSVFLSTVKSVEGSHKWFRNEAWALEKKGKGERVEGKGWRGKEIEAADRWHSRTRVFVLPFGMKKSGLHKDEFGFAWDLVGNDGNSEVAIQEGPCLFGSCVAVVVSVAASVARWK